MPKQSHDFETPSTLREVAESFIEWAHSMKRIADSMETNGIDKWRFQYSAPIKAALIGVPNFVKAGKKDVREEIKRRAASGPEKSKPAKK